MRRWIGTLLLVTIVAGFVGATGTKEAAAEREAEDREALEQIFVDYARARSEGDAATMVAVHDLEAIKMPQDQPMFTMPSDAAVIAAKWAEMDRSQTVNMQVNPKETVIMGDYAYSMGTYTTTSTPKGGGEPSVFNGKFLTILRRNADGEWLVWRDSYSSNTPPEPAVGQYSFGTPVNLGEGINTEAPEGSPCISADRLELYFHSGRPGGSGGFDIWVATRTSVDAEWGEAVNLGPTVNSDAHDIAPSISADGLELYFSDYMAYREGGTGKSDIWVTRRRTKSSPWGEPENLGSVVNTPNEEITPEISPDGRELYFESNRPGSIGGDDIWVAKRATKASAWQEPVWLGDRINGEGEDHCPTMTADGLTLFYDSNPPGEMVGDLMVVRRAATDAPWGEPINLGRGLSTHFASDIASDGTTLYISSQTLAGGHGGGDVWKVPILLNGKPVSE